MELLKIPRPIKEEDLRACRVWIKNLFHRTTENDDLLERIVGNVYGIS